MSANQEARAAEGSQLRATLIGGIAVLLWSLLALFTTWAGDIPPFQLLALSFIVAFAVSLVVVLLKGKRPSLRRQPVGAWGSWGSRASSDTTSSISWPWATRRPSTPA